MSGEAEAPRMKGLLHERVRCAAFLTWRMERVRQNPLLHCNVTVVSVGPTCEGFW